MEGVEGERFCGLRDFGRGLKEWLAQSINEGLLPAISKLLPDAEHRLCRRHIFTNSTKVVKGARLHKLFWKALKSYTEEGFNDAMNELRQQSSKAHLEMCSRDVKRFCKCFYKTWACTCVTCNNMAETFNSWILEAREKPILTMLEEIRQKVMSKMVDKKVQATRCNGIVSPRVQAIINDHLQATRNWKAIEASENVYEVQHIQNSTLTYAVRLDESSCTCRYWDINGIPCEHATTAICSKNESPDSYVASWYSKEAYEASYTFSLKPLNGQNMWKKVDGSSILSSDPRVKHGRPNKRKRAFAEINRKTYTYRIPNRRKQLCSNCKEPGHKSRTCTYKVSVDQS
ncbi:uncharacterized protein LOC141630410 [Silene latifolia]|uniref:uncharacterized protein LOC141630410 n=1 Tax=Silene latifolia TaxID=37657 RepID=UPI003D77829F